MREPPSELDGAKVLYYVLLGDRHERTGRVKHYVDGQLMGSVPALAVAQYAGDKAAYLFHCDANWEVIQDDLLSSPEDAIEEVKRQYSGISDRDVIPT
jgi:hypothetical protein